MAEAQQSQPQKIFSLAELCSSLESVIARTYSGRYWIKAEIAKMNVYGRSGHCFLELVEKQGNETMAEMRANIWKRTFEPLNQRFIETTGEPMKDGLSILFQCSVHYHAKFGLSLHIHDIEPSFTLGEMARERQATIERLKKEGFWQKNKMLPFPALPKRLAVISVESSKGFQDLYKSLLHNEFGYAFSYKLFPSLLQGDAAVASMQKALDAVREELEHFDVCLIIRGGGADLGMSCYDHYDLARAVADFPIPVVTGIGHSTNETVTEMVAHTNKITPTDVAYALIGRYQFWDERLSGLATLMSRGARRILSNDRQRLEVLATGMKYVPRQRIDAEQLALQQLTAALLGFTDKFITSHQLTLDAAAESLASEPQRIVAEQQIKLSATAATLRTNTRHQLWQHNNNLDQYADRISYRAQNNVKSASNKLANLEGQLRLLDPANVLQRGYSITLHNGKAVSDSAELKAGDTVTTRLHSGFFDSTITETQPPNE